MSLAGHPRATNQHVALTGTDYYNKYQVQRNYKQVATISKDTSLRCPKQYSKDTKKAWKAIVPNLILMGSLTEQDLPSLSMMFDAYEDYYQTREDYLTFIQASNSFDKQSMDTRRRLFTTMNDARDQFNRLAARFGCMPTERSRLPINKEEDEDPLAVILEG